MIDSPLKVMYVGMLNDYGDPRRGPCFEYVNFYATLRKMEGITVRHFPFDEILRRDGRDAMNKSLLETAEWGADVYFFALFTDEVRRETIAWLTEKSGAITVNWFGDDHWRFQTFSRHWAPYFHWIITTDPVSADNYARMGCKQVIRSQWGFNHFDLRQDSVDQDIDVSFVGQVHSDRKALVRDLEGRGVNVACYGKGWKNGYLGRKEMIRMFLRSRINLNFSSSSRGLNIKTAAKVFLNRRADGSIHVRSPKEMLDGAPSLFSIQRSQIKGRTFEIPGYGGFLLTQGADFLQEYYQPGKEVEVFENGTELVEKVRYYLHHHEERDRIRLEGHRRTVAEHTYEARFRQIFRTLGIR